MSIEEIIDRKAKEITEQIKKRLKNLVKSTLVDLESYIGELREISKISLPVNLVEILEKGGVIKVFEIGRPEHPHPSDLLHYSLEYFISPRVEDIRNLSPDKTYRVILIIEPKDERKRR